MKDPAEIARRLDELQQKIGIAFKRPALLQEALSHSSFANENPSISPHDNERLEYLGDAVLQLISAEFLFKGRPDAAEGEMTQVRSSMVNTQALAALSEDLGMGEYLLLGKGIARGGGRNLRSLLANAFEAVLGAIFLDQGYDAAYHYCMERFRALPEADVPENFKGRLQHLVQDRFGVTPVYDAIGARAQSGRMREYTAVVYAGGDPLGTGHGRTKQMAEQTAAKEAIRKLTDEAVAPAAEPAAAARLEPAEPRVEEVVAALTSAGEAEAAPAAPEVEEAPVPAPAEEAAPAGEREAVEQVEQVEQAALAEAPPDPVAGGWRGRREVAERAAAERHRPRPEPAAAPAAAVQAEPVATPAPPAPPPPRPQIPPSRQFGAPAAEVEVELATPPPEVEQLVAAPATSLIPATAASTAAAPRQFGQAMAGPPQVAEPEPTAQAEPAPKPRRRTTRAPRAAAATSGSEAAGSAQTETAEKPAPRRRTSRKPATASEDSPPAGTTAEPPKPARRRSTRAKKAEPADTAEPAPVLAEPEPEQPPAPRRRTPRRRTPPQETGTDQGS